MTLPPDQADRQHKRRVLYAAAALFLLLASALLGVRGASRAWQSSSDFGLYYSSTVALVQGEDPYTPAGLEAIAEARGVPTQVIGNAIAPPFTYVPLLPFALLDWPAAKALWLACNLAGAALLFYWLARLAGIPLALGRPITLVWAGWVVGFAPLQTCIGFAQLAVLSSACCAGALLYHREGRWRAASVLWLVAGLLKPQLAAPLLLFFLYQRSWRVIGATFVGGAIVALAAAGWLQWQSPGWFAAWADNIDRLTRGGASDFARGKNPYIFSNLQLPLYLMLGSKALANALAWSIAAGLYLLTLVLLKRPQPVSDDNNGKHNDDASPLARQRLTALAALCIMIGLLPVYHVYYDHTLALVAVAWALGVLARPGDSRRWAWGVLVLCLALLVPGQTALNHVAERGLLPDALLDTLVFRAVLAPHLPWLTLAICIVLLAWLVRRAAPPRSASLKRPAAALS